MRHHTANNIFFIDHWTGAGLFNLIDCDMIAAGNQEVKSIDESIRVLDNYEIGQSIMFDVRRSEAIRTVEVKIMDIS